ncbi:MAG: LPD7 domain-containing protein [Methylibium sp.]
MDADNSPARQAPQAQGGTVEPANRARLAIAKFQTPEPEPRERYELRDPFAEVTYRANTLPEMVAKADQLDSNRFVAIAEDGKRTPIQKVDGEWHRGPQRPALPERPLDPLPARDEVPEATNVVPMPGAGKAASQPDQVDTKSIAKIEAQAERAALMARLEAALLERYIVKRAPVTVGDVTIGRTEYRFRGDTSRVAFTESTFRLATDTNSPSVARSMVDVAEARNWKALRVSGNEDFKRMVWLEASVRGVKPLGYEPNPGDLEVLKREREARLVNRIEPARDSSGNAATPAEKASARGSGGRKAVLAAIEAVLVARKVPEKQRAAVMAAATEKLAQRIRDGQAPKIKVYDKAAPSQRPVVVPTPELQRTRDRAAPAPAR